MPPHALTNFEMKKYYESEPRFNGDFSRDNMPKKVKNGAYAVNLDEYNIVGTHSIALFCNRSEIVYFDIVLVLSMFLKKLQNLLEIKT